MNNNSKITLLQKFLEVRKHTETLCAPLQTEDYVLQPVADVSPPKWHLGHTTWFFEQFILVPNVKNYQVFNTDFAFVFNSYYENIGKRVLRSNRGNMSRPTVLEVFAYRDFVTEAIKKYWSEIESTAVAEVLEIGINHEQQHQELLLTDIKYILGHNPLFPAYGHFSESENVAEPGWVNLVEGVYNIGFNGNTFAFDNEFGRHKVYLHKASVRKNLVSNAEYLEFIEAGGYQDFNLWHSEGWDFAKALETKAPMYWYKIDGQWHHYTLAGLKPIDLNAPVTHISFYEAFAFAQFKKLRLPTEFEWEIAQDKFTWGSRWEWTESAYLPYPNYKKASGALGEYNGKFMVNQKVLRGASVATPKNHSRATYRNFFHPHLRWQYTGIRLAK